MTKMVLDFVEQPLLSLRQITWLGLALLLAGLVLSGYVFGQYQHAQCAHQVVTLAVSQQTQAIKKPVTKKERTPALNPVAVKYANQTATLLNIPWTQLFQALEQIDMQDIALLAIEPSVNKQQLVLTGEARRMPALLAYLASIEQLPMLSRVHLKKHQVAQDTPDRTVGFTIIARWL